REAGAEVVAPGPVCVRIDAADRPVGVSLAGRKGRIVAADGATGLTPPLAATDYIVAPVGLTLRAAIALKRRSDHPILLVDESGALAGLCGNAEIYRDLLRQLSIRRIAPGRRFRDAFPADGGDDVMASATETASAWLAALGDA